MSLWLVCYGLNRPLYVFTVIRLRKLTSVYTRLLPLISMESLEDFFVDFSDDPYNWRDDDTDSADDSECEEETSGADAKMPEDWEPAGASTFPYKVLFNNVDEELLATARATVHKIVANIKKAVGLKATVAVNHHSINILKLSKIWFNNELLRELLNRVNDALTTERVSAKEILGFIAWNCICVFTAAAQKSSMILARRLKQYTQQQRSASLTRCIRKFSRVCQRSVQLLMLLAVMWRMMYDVPLSAWTESWCHCMRSCERHAEEYSSYQMKQFYVKMITMSVNGAIHASRVALHIFITQTRLSAQSCTHWLML